MPALIYQKINISLSTSTNTKITDQKDQKAMIEKNGFSHIPGREEAREPPPPHTHKYH